jgi:DNA-binding response OmpR family regulator
MNVLVVEDDPLAWHLLNVWLTDEGHEPYWASRATQAYEWLSTEPIQLVLLDIDLGLGQLSGIDVLRTMIEHEFWKDIPIIILSGLPDHEIRERAKPPVVDLLRHVSVSLEKPVNMAKLRIAMARAISRG